MAASSDAQLDGSPTESAREVEFTFLSDVAVLEESIGLTPVLDPKWTEGLSELRDPHVLRQLIAALADDNVFVGAHVILTQISGIEHQAFPTWNGLRVDIEADGTVNIDPDQRFELARRWDRWYHTEPRPRMLPADND